MNPLDILIRMEEAAQTLRRMPAPRGPSGHRSAWPEWLRDPWDKYNQPSAIQDLDAKARITPSPEEIDRMDETIPWLQILEPWQAKVVWARATGHTWKRCARLIGASDQKTGRAHVLTYLGTIAQRVGNG